MTELPGWLKARVMWVAVVGTLMVTVYLIVRYLGEMI